MKQDFAYGVVLISYKDSIPFFLVVKHAEGHWGFPKGHKNTGESDSETALRELQEETGLVDVELLNIPPIVDEYSFEKDGETITKQVSFFVGVTDSPDLKPDMHEVLETKWLCYDDAYKILTFGTSKRVLASVSELI